MRFRQRDADGFEVASVAPEFAAASGIGQAVVDVLRQAFCRGVGTLEAGKRIEVAVIQRREGSFQRFMRAAGINHHPLRLEPIRQECRTDDKGRAMQRLGRAENLAAKGMSDHDVIADFDCKQNGLLIAGGYSAAGYSTSWQSTPLGGPRISGSRAGRSWNLIAGASSVSSAGSARRSSAAASRRLCVQRARCDGATRPT